MEVRNRRKERAEKGKNRKLRMKNPEEIKFQMFREGKTCFCGPRFMVLTGPRDKKPRRFWKLRQCNGQEEDVCGAQTMTGLDWICVGLLVKMGDFHVFCGCL